MSVIVTKYVADHKLSKDMSDEELSQHAPALLELLTDKLKRDKEGETLKRIAQRITQDNLSEKDVESIVKALTESASNDSAEKIISATLILEITRSANKIQKERSEQRENEGIDFSDHFSLESVKERLDSYDIFNTLNIQALANIQKAISSGQLRDPGVPGVKWFNTFLKKDRFLPETGKPLLPRYLRKLGAVFAVVSHGAKNLSEAMTIA
ncbi:hypothetical protein RhiirC2_798100, partial [Rhizophagus irregularis]